MKIRNGFVSNSSSSSFVIIGFKLPTDDEIKKKYLEFKGIEVSTDEDDLDDKFYDEICNEDNILTGDGEYWVGKIVADGDDFYEYNKDGMDISSAIAEAEKMREIFNIPADVPVKLYAGERAC